MFTPIETSIGALLLHQATSVLLFQNGNILGASGILRRVLSAPSKETLAFIVGMAASILPLRMFVPELATNFPPMPTTLQTALFTVGVGALVGWGTKVSNGCTSGHMLCGLSRFSPYSTAAVATFFPVAIITHHLMHPTLLTEACPGGMPCYTPTYPSKSTTVSLVLLGAVTIVAARTIPKLVAKSSATDEKSSPKTDARIATQLFAGLEFGLGLHISQMAHPGKVTSFLSFPIMEAWDPSLALVILFGVLPNILEIQAKGFSKPPSFNDKFMVPKRTVKDIDARLLLGAAVFGIGWGLSGTCPGPAVLRAVSQPSWGLLWIGGFWLGGLLDNKH